MELVLKRMLNFLLQVLWHVVSMCNISDSGHWDRAHELVGKTWQLRFQKSDDMAVADSKSRIAILEISIVFVLIIDDHQITIAHLEHAVCESRVVIWSVVTLVTTFDLACIYEIEES